MFEPKRFIRSIGKKVIVRSPNLIFVKIKKSTPAYMAYDACDWSKKKKCYIPRLKSSSVRIYCISGKCPDKDMILKTWSGNHYGYSVDCSGSPLCSSPFYIPKGAIENRLDKFLLLRKEYLRSYCNFCKIAQKILSKKTSEEMNNNR